MKLPGSRAALGLLLAAWPAAADDARRAAKAGYHLLHRTPAELRRELSTDRPDRTESAYTVDAGWFQVEGDVLAVASDRHNPEREPRDETGFAVLPLNLKAGLTRDVDVQFIVAPWRREEVKTPAEGRRRVSGPGDLVTRVKVNLRGNDGGATALAVMPYAKWPTAGSGLGNGEVEGGLIVPFAWHLPGGFTLGMMTQFDARREDDGGTHAGFINSLTLSRPLAGDLGAFVEFFSDVDADGGPWAGTLDLGLTLGVGEDVQLDAGVLLGVTRAAPDLGVFAGFAFRF